MCTIISNFSFISHLAQALSVLKVPFPLASLAGTAGSESAALAAAGRRVPHRHPRVYCHAVQRRGLWGAGTHPSIESREASHFRFPMINEYIPLRQVVTPDNCPLS